MKDPWQEAFDNPGTAVPIGRMVVCDCCSEDYTDRPDHGGVLTRGRAYCPKCTTFGHAPAHQIIAKCTPGMSFADFVREFRKATGNETIRVTRF